MRTQRGERFPTSHSRLFPHPKAPNSVAPTLGTLSTSRGSYQSACVLEFLRMRWGPGGLSQVLHCTARLGEEPR